MPLLGQCSGAVLFEDGVLIVEGDAEAILLPALSKLIGNDLTEHGVSSVNVRKLLPAYLVDAIDYLRRDCDVRFHASHVRFARNSGRKTARAVTSAFSQ